MKSSLFIPENKVNGKDDKVSQRNLSLRIYRKVRGAVTKRRGSCRIAWIPLRKGLPPAGVATWAGVPFFGVSQSSYFGKTGFAGLSKGPPRRIIGRNTPQSRPSKDLGNRFGVI
jgi:hypothetical protein